MEEEVFTPPRGGGGVRSLSLRGVPREVRAVHKPFPDGFPEDSLRDGGQCQKNIGSPVDMLVDTVSRMQKHLAILREEDRVLRTPAMATATAASTTATYATRLDRRGLFLLWKVRSYG